MLHTVIFIGRSGCGKGTQSALLKEWILGRDLEKRHILDVETGAKFREFIRSDSYSAKLSKAIYMSDRLQPNFLACIMWGDMLVSELEENMHLFFDGAPRSRPEAEILTTALEFYGRKRPKVINISVSRKWSEEKLLARGRFDDMNLEKIDKRLDWFDKDVMPAIEYFKQNAFYDYIEVNGEQTIEKVHEDILKSYDHYLQNI